RMLFLLLFAFNKYLSKYIEIIMLLITIIKTAYPKNLWIGCIKIDFPLVLLFYSFISSMIDFVRLIPIRSAPASIASRQSCKFANDPAALTFTLSDTASRIILK